MLASKNRIVLKADIKSWIKTLLSQPKVKLEQISPEVAIESCSLPGNPHLDPADRILIASARHLNAPLLSFDQKIKDYAKQGHLQII